MADAQAMEGVHFHDARGPEGMRLYAIGDVHGRLDLLAAMHARIWDEIERDRPTDWRIIHVGDYVDRGPDSKGVLDFLVAGSARDERVMALKGNHDQGFQDFLDGNARSHLFVDFGGETTCRSYGVAPDFSSQAALRATRTKLAKAMPHDHRVFLESLATSLEFGDFFFCHAGIQPGVPLDRQDPDDLMWIRNAFLKWPGLHPKIIVHGHTPQNEADVLANRVNVDTLAYASGVLTALVVDGGEKRILEVTG